MTDLTETKQTVPPEMMKKSLNNLPLQRPARPSGTGQGDSQQQSKQNGTVNKQAPKQPPQKAKA